MKLNLGRWEKGKEVKMMRKVLVGIFTLIFLAGFTGVALAATTTQHIANPHQNFSVNTAGCASCHTTHNAAGPKLLSGSSTYVACTNCHDGTESVYDVKLGQVGTTDSATTTYVDSNAGLFEGTSQSRHAANSGTNIDLANFGAQGGYSGTNIFTCASCHDPHKKLSDTVGDGTGYNARLLKAAPKAVLYTDTVFGKLNEIDNSTLQIKKSSNANSVLSGSWGYMNVYPQKPVLYQYDGVTYTQISYTSFDPATGTFTGTFDTLTYDYYATFWPKAPKVDITYANYRTANPAATGPETATYDDDINKWCATCHNDYGLSTDAKVTSGDYTSKYRHAVGVSDHGLAAAAKTKTYSPHINGTAISPANIYLPVSSSGNIICLTCHFAHGSKATSQVGSDTVTIAKDGGGTITNVGKLLRYDNRDTCEACHQK